MVTRNLSPNQAFLTRSLLNFLIFFAFGLILFLVAYVEYKHLAVDGITPNWNILFFLLGLGSINVIVILLKLPVLRAAYLLSLLILLTFIYSAEAYIEVTDFSRDIYPHFFSKFNLLQEMKKQGIDAFPNYKMSGIYPQYSEYMKKNGLALHPINGVSNAVTLHCKETSDWSIYQSDEFGFNNTKGLYQLEQNVLIGDSYANGACVEPHQTLSALLQRQGIEMLSLGSSGAGPLQKLAIFREYAAPLKPKNVVWLYYANDIGDMTYELEDMKILYRYAEDPGFTQNLMSHQAEIDASLKSFFNEKLKQDLLNYKSRLKKFVSDRIERLIKLQGLQAKFEISLVFNEEKDKIGILQDVMRDVQENVQSWNGNLYFLYVGPSELKKKDRLKDSIFEAIEDLGIPLIDFEPIVRTHPDPSSLYVFYGSHFNPEGYQLLSHEMARLLSNEPA